MDDGREFVSQVDYPKGSIQNMMDDAELRAKFDILTKPVLGDAGSQTLADAIAGVEAATSISSIMRATTKA
jgi:hypothetical protein